MGRMLVGGALLLFKPVDEPGKLTERYFKPFGKILWNADAGERKTLKPAGVLVETEIEPAAAHAGAGESVGAPAN